MGAEVRGRSSTLCCLRRKTPSRRDVWHLDEVVVTISGQKHWLWRAVDQDGYVLDEIVQGRRNTKAAKRLLRRLLRKQGCPPRRMITDKLGSYVAAQRQIMPDVEHRSHKGLNNRAPISGSASGRRKRCGTSRTRIVTAADEARRRPERDLHDGAQQRLVVLLLSLRALRIEARTTRASAAPG